MTLDAEFIDRLIDSDLERVSDPRVLSHIQELRVTPTPKLRDWDYGKPGERFVCWSVLEHRASNTGIAYCEEGFGPSDPWGLVFLEGDAGQLSIGMDCAWYRTFLEVYFESQACADLAIWRVVKTDASGSSSVLTQEGEWDETWKQVYALRERDPASRYDCLHGIAIRDYDHCHY